MKGTTDDGSAELPPAASSLHDSCEGGRKARPLLRPRHTSKRLEFQLSVQRGEEDVEAPGTQGTPGDLTAADSRGHTGDGGGAEPMRDR